MTMEVKYPPPRSCNWAFWKWADIPSKSNSEFVYLRRLRVIQTPWFAFYIHWIKEPDLDRYPHDHPWNFFSFVLRGFYSENLYVDLSGDVSDSKVHKTFSLHHMSMDIAHKITSVSENLVTLVFTGKRKRTWYFWTENGFVEWTAIDKDDDLL